MSRIPLVEDNEMGRDVGCDDFDTEAIELSLLSKMQSLLARSAAS